MQIRSDIAWPSSAEEFTSLVSDHQPAVFRGLASGWLPAGVTASPNAMLDWLVQLLGEKYLPVSTGFPGDRGFFGVGGFKGKAVPTTLTGDRRFRDAAEQLLKEATTPSGHVIYLQSIPLPELTPHLRLPMESCPKVSGHWRTWIGSGGHRVGIHIDGDENFFCLLYGRKKFLLFPFEALPHLYVAPIEAGPYGSPCSLVDPEMADHTSYPDFSKAMQLAHVVELSAGDVLYLPSHCWHAVESVGLNVACNYWWKDVDEPRNADAQSTFLRAVRFFRGLPAHWRDYWLVMIKHFALYQSPPYAYLSSNDQGLFGAETHARVEALDRLIDEAETERSARSATSAEITGYTLNLSRNVTFQPSPSSGVSIRAGQKVVAESVSVENVSLLLIFLTPTLLADVLSQLPTSADFGALVVELYRRGVLIKT